MLQEHSLFCQCFKIVNIGHFAVESESQTSSPSHEFESEGGESESKSLYIVTRVRVRVTKKVTRVGLESESRVVQVCEYSCGVVWPNDLVHQTRVLVWVRIMVWPVVTLCVLE